MHRHSPCHPTSSFFLSQEKNQEIWDCMKTRDTASGLCCWRGRHVSHWPFTCCSGPRVWLAALGILTLFLWMYLRNTSAFRRAKVQAWGRQRYEATRHEAWSARCTGSKIPEKGLLELWVSRALENTLLHGHSHPSAGGSCFYWVKNYSRCLSPFHHTQKSHLSHPLSTAC